MKTFSAICIALLCAFTAQAQHTLTVSVKKADSQQPLSGATITISPQNQTVIADSAGVVTFQNLPKGSYSIEVSFVGLETETVDVEVPQSTTPLEILLVEAEEVEEEIVVTATRLSRSIANSPTRVEVISGEELTEKGNMKPGEIRMLLSESTGIQTQQTSATSYNTGIRIQGLEGRYTQLLKDGYPLYSGFSGGLSLLQIPPLDLKQVEVIKGAASTLYGGGAIAGLVNLVSKTPGPKKELSFIANGTTAGGLDLSGFYSERYGKAGMTVFAARNTSSPYDPADIGLTAIPKFKRYTINPRLFLYGRKTTANVGLTYITEDRLGGSIDYIKNGGNGFFEKNNTNRITTQLGIAHELSDHSTLQLKTSYSRFDRKIHVPYSSFDALQQSSFSEITWNRKGEEADWVIGANVITEDLNEASKPSALNRDYHLNTYGLFIQNAWSLSNAVVLETGLRGDYVDHYGFELLPRISAMFRVLPQLTTRIGGGMGYKTPTIFTEEAERIHFHNLLPIDVDETKNERSIGGNWDINYNTHIGDVGVSINHMFFYTRLNHPLIMVSAGGDKLAFENANGHLDTRGVETNMRFTLGNFKLFTGYTFTDVNTHYNDKVSMLPLTARHRLNNVLMYEVEEKLKLGLEAYYYGKQKLNNGTYSEPYWIMGLMTEKLWENFSLFLNFENFTDTRQSKFGPIYDGTLENPQFRDIYAPVDGFVVNGGLKIKL